MVVALGFFALAMAYSARAVLGLAMPVWEEELHWSRSYISNVAAVALVIMAIVAPLSGYLLDRKGGLLLSYNSSTTKVDRLSRDLKSAVAQL